jgi:phosphonopyruvate decarboxylase
MVTPGTFLDRSRAAGFRLWTGVPCSYLTPFIDGVIGDAATWYLPAANEGDAVAIGAGARLGGVPAVVMMQNSGLGNAVNPLTSLCDTLRVPVLLIVTLRGDPEGPADEPQHARMGPITTSLLDLMGIAWSWFPREDAGIDAALRRAITHMTSTGLPYALVMKKGSVSAGPPSPPLPQRHPAVRGLPPVETPRATRRAWLQAVQRAVREDDVMIASTGYLGRELYALGDRVNQLYLVGSMGCASSVGLGVALAQRSRRVVVLEGDGAGLMRLGAWSAIGYARPDNLRHLLIDNGCHDSTGGQSSLAGSVDFCALAAGSGYATVTRLADPAGLAAWLDGTDAGPAFLHVPILPGTPGDLPRPTMAPPDVARRFAAHMGVTL